MDDLTKHDSTVRIRVLLIESSRADARLVTRAISHARGAMEVRGGLFVVTRADSLDEAIDLLARNDYDVALLDAQLPESPLAQLQSVSPEIPVVVMTRYDDEGLALEAIQHGAQDYVAKDELDGRLLRRAIRHAVQRKRSEAELLRHARRAAASQLQIECQAAELKSRAEQLDRITRELDDFAYITSHDLKEPLRGIAAYCEILLADYAEQLDDTGQHRLKTLVRLCNRLENLINDLLTYCRVGGVQPAETNIDLEAIVTDIIQTLHPAIDRRNAQVSVQRPLPPVNGDPTLIAMALRNLIANGLKFNDIPNPHVQLGSLATEPPTLYIRDNGIGIDRKHHEEIFTIFRRLHGSKQYEGSGAGLTIVRKIVDAHGGRIWIESTPGQGSTFFLTLAPAAGGQIPEQVAWATPLAAPHWFVPAHQSESPLG